MKFNYFILPFSYKRRRLFLFMKLIVALILFSSLQGNAKIFAQSISLKKKNAPLEDILKDIGKQAGYVFWYEPQTVKPFRDTDVSLQNESLETALKKVLENKNLAYSIVGKTIVIKSKQERNAQSVVVDPVSGIVVDINGQPIPGATIRVVGTTRTSSTDDMGSFQLEDLGDGDVISVSHTGYETVEIKLDAQRELRVVLKQRIEAFEEVVVVGYGRQQKSHVTGAVSVLDMAKKKDQPFTNASQALHGVSGLWVNQAGGKPGQDVATIRIRGVGTLNNQNPLVLVDGIEFNMNELNPNDIESITVLKDASAAIYGSRSANGVILVTTKTGQRGRTAVNYSFSHGIQQTTRMPDVVWDPILYMQMRNTAMINEGSPITYSEEQIEEYRNGMKTDPHIYPNINWFDEVLKNGYLQQHNLSFSGGSEKTIYNLSLGFMDQDGVLIDANHANRYSLALNLATDISSKFKVGGSVHANYRKYDENAHGTPYFFNRFMRVLPIFSPYLPDGRYGNAVFATPGRNAVENPLMLLKEGRKDHAVQRILAKAFADYELPFGLRYNINLGIDKLDGYARQFVPFLTTYNPKTEVPYYYNNNPYAFNYDDNVLNMSFFQTLTWDKKIDLHNVSAMVGTSYISEERGTFDARIEGYFDNALTDISAGSINPRNNGVETRDKLGSYFGRLNYNYDEKYLVETTFRYDGSARFAPANRWAFFPSFSAGWRLDRESFFPQFSGLNLLKLRGSWGKLGNQDVPLFSYLPKVSLGSDYNFNGVIVPGAAITGSVDPNISWETTTTTNLGLDAEMWNGKLGLSFELFKRRTTDILRPVNLPAQVGNLSGAQRNIGVVDNKGYELNLSHRNLINDFSYEVSGGITYVKNEIVDLNGETVIDGRRILKEGYPIDAYYLYDAEGIYQNQEQIDYSAVISSNVKPGFLKYRDVNGDDKINGDDRIIVGSSIPKYMYSFNLKFGYKNFSFDTFWQGVQGLNIYPTNNLVYPINNGAGITHEWVTDSWTPERPDARLPILVTPQGASENYQPSTFWLQDASYLRLQNVQLNYSLPKDLISKVGLSNFSFFVNGQNLLTFSNFKQFDPEKEIKDDTLYDYPMLKTFSFGLSATF
ncbi:TonB-dependent receptor [Sphingobacterium sp. SGR-19]|nr:TonB-dependent receptor [Sphingobacterium sp. SGR-19]